MATLSHIAHSCSFEKALKHEKELIGIKCYINPLLKNVNPKTKKTSQRWVA
jgi:hypothetical protein